MKNILIITEEQYYNLFEYTDRQSKAFDNWYTKTEKNNTSLSQDQLKDLFFSSLARLPKKDIFQYKSTDELISTLSTVQQNIPTSKRIKNAVEGKDYDTIFDNDKVKIIVPITHEGSCKHGIDTKWCTAMKNFPIYFTTHTADGFLYRIIYKDYFITRKYKINGEERYNKLNEKYSLYINNKGTQKLIDINDNPVDFEDLPFFTDDMETAIVTHYNENFKKIKNSDLVSKWLK